MSTTQGKGLFTQVPKRTYPDLDDLGVSWNGSAVFGRIQTHARTSAIGTLYMPHDLWGAVTGFTEEAGKSAVDELQDYGLLAVDWKAHYVLLRNHMLTQNLGMWKYLKSAVPVLAEEIRSPILRVVLASEILRAPLAGMPEPKRSNVHAVLDVMWREITNTALPGAAAMNGKVDRLPEHVWRDLANMPHADQVISGMSERKWTPFDPGLRELVTRAFLEESADVTYMEAKRVARR